MIICNRCKSTFIRLEKLEYYYMPYYVCIKCGCDETLNTITNKVIKPKFKEHIFIQVRKHERIIEMEKLRQHKSTIRKSLNRLKNECIKYLLKLGQKRTNYDINEVAKKLNVSFGTVQRWIKDKQLDDKIDDLSRQKVG